MTVRYDKLWSLMKTNKMKKSELAKAAELTQYTMTKLNQDRLVSMEVMLRLCKIFHCDIGDIMEVMGLLGRRRSQTMCTHSPRNLLYRFLLLKDR